MFYWYYIIMMYLFIVFSLSVGLDGWLPGAWVFDYLWAYGQRAANLFNTELSFVCGG